MDELRLFVDDLREEPAGWDVARHYEVAIEKLSTFKYVEVSLDHDIASYRKDGREMTGYDIALWLANRKMNGGYVPPVITSHSANPVGRANTEGVIKRYLS